jgi:hypothetical protein
LVGDVEYCKFTIPPNVVQDGIAYLDYEQARIAHVAHEEHQATTRREMQPGPRADGSLAIRAHGFEATSTGLLADPKFLSADFFNRFQETAGRTRGILSINVRNQGDNTLKAVRILYKNSFQSAILFRTGKSPETLIPSPSEDPSGGKANRLALPHMPTALETIDIGDMPPSTKVDVLLFLNSEPPDLYKPELIHETGFGTVHMPMHEHSLSEFTRDGWKESPWIFMFGINLGALILLTTQIRAMRLKGADAIKVRQ